MKTNLVGIYKIENIVNGNIYIGSAVNLKARFCSEHNLNRSCMCNLISGKQKSHKGWITI
ncbi:hypothetical protein LCGC14_1784670 [marine sediment metagenome]|uniref:GIY-YIG domain-containing protein n=1 Tax=marine sediment metagenome TaxID=412755 RepID=A0A0F9JU06_9ZZZZ